MWPVVMLHTLRLLWCENMLRLQKFSLVSLGGSNMLKQPYKALYI
jgi:hypothetical protein